MKCFEINPIDGRKSFYGKCLVIETDGFYFLKSYNTFVAAINKKTKCFHRIWEGWSVTTARHINSFRDFCGLESIGKSAWCNLPCEPMFYHQHY